MKRKSSKDILECRICGDIARGLNFDVTSCMSCKAFFRRNAFKKSTLVCVFENKCSITKITRFYCGACRLKKCFELGMNSDLIQRIPISKSTRIINKQLAIPTPKPLNLLQNDRSYLSMIDWNLLTNIISIFDNQNIRGPIDNYFNSLHSLPPKLRSRRTGFHEILSQFFYGIQMLVERTPDLHTLSISTRRVVTKHNLYLVAAVNGQFLCREWKLYDNSDFSNACIVHYGLNTLLDTQRISSRCDSNGNLIKLFLFIIIFSSNISTTIYDHEEAISSEESSLSLMYIQNIYITILWKYFLYLYDFKQAVMRYSNIVKYLLDIIRQLGTMEQNDAHNQMIETITEKAERELVIEE